MIKRILSVLPVWAVTMIALLGPALAESDQVRSKPWQMWFQPAASPTAERVFAFNAQLLVIETLITLFVLGLMVYIVIRFNEKANPTPSKTTHNTALEIIWTGLPILILIGIAVPSLKHLYFADRTTDAEMTLKVIGNQWYWSYEYPDQGGIAFDSLLVPDDELKAGQPRLLSVDNEVVLPVETNIRLLLSSKDVIHNWAMPSLAIKLDTVPGRTNETWTRINKEFAGKTLYGMCSELCGVNHGFMPIAIRAVSKEEFAKWVETAKKKFASIDGTLVPVAGATMKQTFRVAEAVRLSSSFGDAHSERIE